MSDSYSQHGEDLIVKNLFGQMSVAHNASLLDIGAWGVKDLSNSRLFIENGWRATLVEFSPMPVHSLLLEYGYNERVRVIQAAVTPNPQPVVQFDITENALSTADPRHKGIWADAKINYYGKMWVPTLSVQQLLDQFFGSERIDFVSIDTEGTSVEIALALLSTDWRPEVAIVEFDDKLAYLLQNVSKWGYKLIETNGANVILAR